MLETDFITTSCQFEDYFERFIKHYSILRSKYLEEADAEKTLKCKGYEDDCSKFPLLTFQGAESEPPTQTSRDWQKASSDKRFTKLMEVLEKKDLYKYKLSSALEF